MNRQQRQQIAEQTVQYLLARSYPYQSWRIDLSALLERCVQGTLVYLPEQFSELPTPVQNQYHTQFTLCNETTLQAAERLAVQDESVIALNFASAVHVGGGFLTGSHAQEESLARASGLYQSLINSPAYYQCNRALGNELYTDAMIYSPKVPVFRRDDASCLAQPYCISMLTVPAVRAIGVRERTPDLITNIEPVMLQRMDKMLQLLAALGYKRLILGAWGCGAFQNDVDFVAKAFYQFLTQSYGGVFERVHFAVFDTLPEQTIYRCFSKYFTD